MNNLSRFVLILFFITNLGSLNAQESILAGDHLEPAKGVFTTLDYQFEYYTKVRKILFDGLSDSPEIRFQVMPSFTPEYVLQIEFDREYNKYFIVYHICEKMIWYNDRWKRVRVFKYKSEIDKESVELIRLLFDKAISQTKYSDKDYIVLDGVNYYFSINNFGLKKGTVRSPISGSKMRRLVDVGLELIDLTKSRKSMVSIDKNFRQKIERLIYDL